MDKLKAGIEKIKDKATNGEYIFRLDKEKYPDVEETPYGFIYNVNNRSITDLEGQEKAFNKNYKYSPAIIRGFTVQDDYGDEVNFHDFDTAYKFAKGIIKDWKNK